MSGKGEQDANGCKILLLVQMFHHSRGLWPRCILLWQPGLCISQWVLQVLILVWMSILSQQPCGQVVVELLYRLSYLGVIVAPLCMWFSIVQLLETGHSSFVHWWFIFNFSSVLLMPVLLYLLLLWYFCSRMCIQSIHHHPGWVLISCN
jgi:hypothetical protein